MILKKVEMYGFKSFADKVEVDFNEGITGIVGPNGCGKSNVAEAIRWVLGEQSAKNLRGGSMQDVIFAGSDYRKSLSYCEVSLIFDNSTRLFPINFDELIITRKLYRSGESEYLINRTRCRLADIVEIIKDTGIGKDGYSIIGQGSVAKIVDCKPLERRAIFEEATGIAKFKARKNKAETNLARARENIDRLKDIIIEINNRRGPLEKQAEDAKVYLKLRDELKMHEVNNYLYHYDNNSEAIDAVNTRLKAIKEELNQRLADIDKADAEYNKAVETINELDVLINDLRDEQTQLMIEAEKRKGAGELHTERIKSMTLEKDKMSKKIETNKDVLLEKADELAGLIEYNKENEDYLESAKQELDDMEKSYLALVDEIIAREKEIDESNKAILATMDELYSIKADTSALKAEKTALLERKDEIELDIQDGQKLLEDKEAEKEDVHAKVVEFGKNKEKLTARRTQLVTKTNENKFTINSLIEETKKYIGSLRGLEEKKKILEAYKTRYEGFSGPVKRLMQLTKEDPTINKMVLGVIADIIKVPTDYEVAIETALGNSVQNVVTKDEEDVKYIIRELKAQGIGRVTFLPMTSFKPRDLDPAFRGALDEQGCIGIAANLVNYDPKFQTIISGLLGSTLVCEDMDSAVRIAKMYRYSFRIVTLSGEILNSSGAITGGATRKNDAANLLSQEREIKETVDLMRKYKFTYDKKTEELEHLKSENEDLLEELTDVEEDLKEASIEYAKQLEIENKIQQQIDETVKELKEDQDLIKNIRIKLAAIDGNLSEVDKHSEDIEGKRSSTDDDIEKNKQEFLNKKEERDRLDKERTELRITIASVEKEVQKTNENIYRIKKEAFEIERENVELNAEIKATDQKILKSEEDFNNSVISDEDKAKNDEIKAHITAVEEQKKTLQTNMAGLLQKKDEYNQDITNIHEKRIKEETNLEKIDSNMLFMQEHIMEEYELDYESAKMFKLVDYDINSSNAEINKLKKAINKLGPVNVQAIDEFKEVDARYIDYNEKKEDLEKAESDLLKSIADLSREMINKFSVEFTKINEHFKVIFKEMFGGGKAHLVLDTSMSDDPLEAGIEIMAQPPGTSLPNITLLSGGQKTLIAISILFAILRSKATPFSVLDEVEAALDESNAKLVAKYLKKFSNETQFVVITHKKPTMEMADRLYGVTMEEKGVSKIVSVKLKDAIEQVEKEEKTKK